MRALVTGGAGFIGSHIVKKLVLAGHDVIVLDDMSGGHPDNVPEGIRIHMGSILDVASIERLFEMYSFDYVYHLAAYAAENLSHFIKRFNYQNNVIGSVNLINAAVNFGVKCFVFTSSIAVYGNQTPPFTESMIPRPEDSYAIAKYAVEQELRISHEMFGLDYVIFRPHNVYGPGQNIGDRYRNVIGIFMNQCLQGKPMTIFGDGLQVRAFSYIDDIASVIANSPDVEPMRNDVFNIGGEGPVNINLLASLVAESVGTNGWTTYLPARQEVGIALSNHNKIKQLFPNWHNTPLKEGLAIMSEWVKKQGPREPQSFDEIEIRKNLPESWR